MTARVTTGQWLPIAALITAGLGWGTTGIFVRALSGFGVSAYDLLIIRLVTAGIAILPFLFIDLRRNPGAGTRERWIRAGIIGFAMVFYYLGAITAFQNLSLAEAALVIGSSPLIAWLWPLLIEKRFPRGPEIKSGFGVILALVGLAVFLSFREIDLQRLTDHTGFRFEIGLFGAMIAAFVTVANARALKTWGSGAPTPFQVTISTVILGILIAPVSVLMGQSSGLEKLIEIVRLSPGLSIGFGILSTAVPGLAMAYAGVRLRPEATATASLQLQIWTAIFAWAIFGERLTGIQIAAAGFVILGTAICLRPKVA